MTETINILIKLMSSGDKKAYTTIFEEFYGPLVLYAKKFVQDQDEAEDIVQEFFCHLWANRKNVSNIKAFKNYIYSSIRYRSLNHLRDNHTVPIVNFELQKEEDFLLEMTEQEIYRELYAAINKLPEKCRQIMLMKLAGKENSEISRELDITEDTVRSQLRRGREILQKQLSDLLYLVLIIYLHNI